jgi:predicted HicB family RNase H-like nuclease
MATKRERINLRVEPTLRAKLVADAKANGVSLNAYCARLLHLGHEYLISTKENDNHE